MPPVWAEPPKEEYTWQVQKKEKEEIDENVFDNDGKDVDDEYKMLFGDVNETPKESPRFNDIHNTSFGEPEKTKPAPPKEADVIKKSEKFDHSSSKEIEERPKIEEIP